jgi:hypothetical protein
MSFQDFDFEQPSHEDPPIILPPVDSSHDGLKIAGAVVLVIAVAATGYLVFRNRQVAAPASAPAVTPAPAATEVSKGLGADGPAIDLPPLDETDDVVRGLMKELSSNPSVAAWLMTRNLIRNFTVVVSNIAAGEPAARQVTVLRPKGAFQVEERGEDLFINSRGYSRYLPLSTAASSVNPEDAAKLYTTLKPRIDEAYAELGQAGTTFDQTLERAIVLLLKTPVPEGRVPVEPNGAVGYRFANPVLEKLTPTQKLLIRFGPDNQRAVQTSLRNIALALGIPPDRLP